MRAFCWRSIVMTAMIARLRAAQRGGLELRGMRWSLPRPGGTSAAGKRASPVYCGPSTCVLSLRPTAATRESCSPRQAPADPIDATVALLAAPGDRIVTSDPGGLARLTAAARRHAVIVPCWSPAAIPLLLGEQVGGRQTAEGLCRNQR